MWIAFVWLAFALVNATQTVVGMHAEGMRHAWTRLFVTLLLSWLVWALATPLVLRLARRYPPTRWKPVSTWLIHLGACAAIGLVYAAWTAGLQLALHPWGKDEVSASFGAVGFAVFYSEFHLSLILYAAIMAISHTLDSRKRLAIQQTEAARLSEQLSKAQLDALRRQLEPHFLFNTLNAVAGLIREARGDDAVNMIAGLSDLLRRVLEGSDRQEVPLGEEMGFLERYLEIQKMRFAERLQLSIEVPRELLAALVPSLILQPMVENAIQHGIAKSIEGGTIRIAAARTNGLLTMSVYNSGPDLEAGWEKNGSGIGISNVRGRLRSLYGDGCTLSLRNHEAGGVEARVSFPYRAGLFSTSE
jgi:two-component system, LytTR family, sensor kinase